LALCLKLCLPIAILHCNCNRSRAAGFSVARRMIWKKRRKRMRKRLFCCLRPGAFSDTGCCLNQPAVSVGQAQQEHFDWLQALSPVRMHLHSAKAWACAGLSRHPLLNWPHARKVFRGWEGDLLLVAYLRHPARCAVGATAFQPLNAIERGVGQVWFGPAFVADVPMQKLVA
jgi:hypothetical protein